MLETRGQIRVSCDTSLTPRVASRTYFITFEGIEGIEGGYMSSHYDDEVQSSHYDYEVGLYHYIA